MAIDFTTARRQRRRGISLLEVLFAIFILAMGMLGLGALIPVGNYQVSQGLRMDHGAACGRAAFRQLEASEMLRPENWVTSGTTSPTFLTTNGPDGNPGTGAWPVFMLDPFLKTRGAGNAYPPHLAPAPTPAFQMERVTLRSMGGAAAADVARADALFRWQDDLPTEIDPDQTNNIDRPVFASATAEYEGKYSWMAMIAPSPVENTAATALSSGYPVRQRRQFTVSIIVYFDRDTGGETAADVEVVPTPVSFNNLTNSLTLPAGIQSKIVPGQWIMLSHQYAAPPGDQSAVIHRWYRVVNVGNRSLDGTAVPVRVQLAGPTFPDPSLLINTNLPQVTIANGVIGVYERTIELDTNSTMSLPGA